MFERIDNLLISAAQYLVRQTELYTNITRKGILTSLIKMFGACTVVNVLILIVGGVVFIKPVLIIFALVYFVMMFIYSVTLIRRLAESDVPQAGFLPKGITRDRFVRLFILGVFFFELFFIIVDKDRDIFPLLIPSLALICEYLLCTTSLPPGEKERKKQEREMEQMTPAPISSNG